MTEENTIGTVTVFGDPFKAVATLTPPANVHYDAGYYINQEYYRVLNGWAANLVSPSILITDANNGYLPFPAFADPSNPALLNTAIVQWVEDPANVNGGYLQINDRAAFDAAIRSEAARQGRITGEYFIDENGRYSDLPWSFTPDDLGSAGRAAAEANAVAAIRAANARLEALGFTPGINVNTTELGDWRAFELQYLKAYQTDADSEFGINTGNPVRQLNIFKAGFSDAITSTIYDAMTQYGFRSIAIDGVAERLTVSDILSDDAATANVVNNFLTLDEAYNILFALQNADPALTGEALARFNTLASLYSDTENPNRLANLQAALTEGLNAIDPATNLTSGDPAQLDRSTAAFVDIALLNAIRPHQEAYALATGGTATDLLAYLDNPANADFLGQVFDATKSNLATDASLPAILAAIQAGNILPGSDAENYLDALKHAIPLQAALLEHQRVNEALILAGQPPIPLTGHFMEAIHHYGLGALPLEGAGVTIQSYLVTEARAGRFSFQVENIASASEPDTNGDYTLTLDRNIYEGDILVADLLGANNTHTPAIPVQALVDLRSIPGALEIVNGRITGAVNEDAVELYYTKMLALGVLPVISSNPLITKGGTVIGFGGQQLQGDEVVSALALQNYAAAASAFYNDPATQNIIVGTTNQTLSAYLAARGNNPLLPGSEAPAGTQLRVDLVASVVAQLEAYGVDSDFIQRRLMPYLAGGVNGQGGLVEHLNTTNQANAAAAIEAFIASSALDEAYPAVAAALRQPAIVSNVQAYMGGNIAPQADTSVVTAPPAPEAGVNAEGVLIITAANEAAWNTLASNVNAIAGRVVLAKSSAENPLPPQNVNALIAQLLDSGVLNNNNPSHLAILTGNLNALLGAGNFSIDAATAAVAPLNSFTDEVSTTIVDLSTLDADMREIGALSWGNGTADGVAFLANGTIDINGDPDDGVGEYTLAQIMADSFDASAVLDAAGFTESKQGTINQTIDAIKAALDNAGVTASNVNDAPQAQILERAFDAALGAQR